MYRILTVCSASIKITQEGYMYSFARLSASKLISQNTQVPKHTSTPVTSRFTCLLACLLCLLTERGGGGGNGSKYDSKLSQLHAPGRLHYRILSQCRGQGVRFSSSSLVPVLRSSNPLLALDRTCTRETFCASWSSTFQPMAARSNIRAAASANGISARCTCSSHI